MASGKWAWSVSEGDVVAWAEKRQHLHGTVVEAAPEIGVVWIIDSVYRERRMVMMQDLLPASPTGRGFAVPLAQFQTRHGAIGQ
ncbi:hypothetical protein ACIQF8_19720 [Pseudarthrobacter sp. NPDC092184]|uniref:hypothetical protein n=1 Tax=unclassified Pseudarthrobacter TaxID=2647000 RepID=UPI003830288C